LGDHAFTEATPELKHGCIPFIGILLKLPMLRISAGLKPRLYGSIAAVYGANFGHVTMCMAEMSTLRRKCLKTIVHTAASMSHRYTVVNTCSHTILPRIGYKSERELINKGN
jgi:hypothetical protein